MSALKQTSELASGQGQQRSIASEIANKTAISRGTSLVGNIQNGPIQQRSIIQRKPGEDEELPLQRMPISNQNNTLQAFRPAESNNTYSGPGKLPFIQTKLTVNTPGDQYEQEADAMADKVMRMKSPFLPPTRSDGFHIQRKCAACEEEDKHVHRKENTATETQGNDELSNYVGSLGSSGQALPESSRQFFEPRFGQDFSNVRVHTDTVAAKSAQSINALAYTTGNNIVFNKGQYTPGSESGQRLLAHELTHVEQQNNKKLRSSPIMRKSPKKHSSTKNSHEANDSADFTKAETYVTDFYDSEDKIINDLYLNANVGIQQFGIYSNVKGKEGTEPPITTIKTVLKLIPGGEDILEVVEMVEKGVAIAKEIEKMTKKEGNKTEPDEATAEALGKSITEFTRQRQVISEQRSKARGALELLQKNALYQGVLLQAIKTFLGPIRPYNKEVITQFGWEYELNLYKEYYVANALILHLRPMSLWQNYTRYDIRDVPDEALKRIIELNKKLGHVPSVVIDPRFVNEVRGLIPGYVEAVKILLEWGVKLSSGINDKPETLHTGDDLNLPYKGKRFKEIN